MEINYTAQWVKLSEYQQPYLQKGAIVRFRTQDTAGNGWKYAVATKIDNYKNLGFVGLDGGTWGYGRCMVPDEAIYEDRAMTVSRDWLLQNFTYIAAPQDIGDVWICEDALQVLRAYEAYTGSSFENGRSE